MGIVKCGLLYNIVECHGKLDLLTATSLNKLLVTITKNTLNSNLTVMPALLFKKEKKKHIKLF